MPMPPIMPRPPPMSATAMAGLSPAPPIMARSGCSMPPAMPPKGGPPRGPLEPPSKSVRGGAGQGSVVAGRGIACPVQCDSRRQQMEAAAAAPGTGGRSRTGAAEGGEERAVSRTEDRTKEGVVCTWHGPAPWPRRPVARRAAALRLLAARARGRAAAGPRRAQPLGGGIDEAHQLSTHAGLHLGSVSRDVHRLALVPRVPAARGSRRQPQGWLTGVSSVCSQACSQPH